MSELFDHAVAYVSAGTTARGVTSDAQKLLMYAYYKQATQGDAPTKSLAGYFDFVGQRKHDAWSRQRGLDPMTARSRYVAMLDRTAPEWRSKLLHPAQA